MEPFGVQKEFCKLQPQVWNHKCSVREPVRLRLKALLFRQFASISRFQLAQRWNRHLDGFPEAQDIIRHRVA